MLTCLAKWAAEIVARLNNTTLEEYLKKNVFEPLAMQSSTFRLEKHPEIQARLIRTVRRTENGDLEETDRPWPDHAPEDCAGSGMFSTVQDYLKVLCDLIKDEPTLLKRETIDKLLFTPQLPENSPALKALLASTDITGTMTGVSNSDKGLNWGLGGLLLQEDVGVLKKGTVTWGGFPNLYWFMNRECGVAGMYASQVVPPGDPESAALAQQFMKAVSEFRR